MSAIHFALIVNADEHLRAELIEIDENLCRSELTPAQRSSFAKRRKQIWEALHPDDKQVAQVAPPVAKHGHVQEKGFAAETAAVSGMSKASINRHVARVETTSRILTFANVRASWSVVAERSD